MLYQYFDSSALVKLYHREQGTDFVDKLVAAGNIVMVSKLTLLELESAFATKARMGGVDIQHQAIIRQRLMADVSQGRIRIATQIEAEDYRVAQALLRNFGPSLGLRTLDALHTAMAQRLIENGKALAMVSADKRLCNAARAAGCPVIEVP